jgi:hypothetical protein
MPIESQFSVDFPSPRSQKEWTPSTYQARRTRPSLVLPYFICASIFSKELFAFGVGGTVVDAYLILLAGYGLFHITGSRIAFRVGGVLVAILMASFILLVIHGHGLRIFIWHGLPAVCIYTGISVIIEKTTSKALVAAYRNTCYWTALFGILQFILSGAGVMILMKVPLRLDSLAYEASHYAIAIGPAVFLSLKEKIKSGSPLGLRGWVIISALCLTVSITAFIIIVCCGFMLVTQKRGSICVLVLSGVLFYLYCNQDMLPRNIRMRIDAVKSFTEGEGELDDVRNLSLVSPLSNWMVAMDSLERGRLFGNGLGGHYYAYMDYFEGSLFSERKMFGINSVGGHSFLIRSISEFGLVGLAVYCGWVFIGFTKASTGERIWWTLSAVFLLGRAIKLGGLFDMGTPIFLLAPFIFDRVQVKPRSRPLGSQ